MPAYIMVEGQKEPDTNVDKASVTVTTKTRIFREENGKRVQAAFADLQIGPLVTVQFTGPVAETCLVQATAGEISILSQNTNAAAISSEANVAGRQVGQPRVFDKNQLVITFCLMKAEEICKITSELTEERPGR
jgi:hypothetical protein